MTGKKAYVALIAALAAFGYLFVLNPQMQEFQLIPGQSFRTSLGSRADQRERRVSSELLQIWLHSHDYGTRGRASGEQSGMAQF